MKALIIGYGSMGKRRQRLLKRLVPDIRIGVIEMQGGRQQQAINDGCNVYAGLDEALPAGPDIAFLCTSPGHHAEFIRKLVDAGVHTFTELNLLDKDYDKIIARSKETGTKVFMSSTMLYDRRIEIIDSYVKSSKKPLTYIYHVGQYLPDWHPWERYQDFFAGKKETNGVREIYAVQLPWIIHTFGEIIEVVSNAHKISGLEIGFHDSIVANFKHANGNIGVFAADVVSRKAVTDLEVIGEDIHLFWHGHNDDLFVYDAQTKQMQQITAYPSIEHADGYSDNIIEDRYLDEVKDFLDFVSGKAVPRYSLEKDQYTLSLIDMIEGKKEGR